MAKSRSKQSQRARAEERRARAERVRRAERRKQRRRIVLAGSVLVFILALIAAAAVVGTRGNGPAKTDQQIVPSTPAGNVTVQTPPGRVPNPSDIEGVIAYDTKGYPAPGDPDAGTLVHDHVPGPVRYAVTPPVGGPHNATWMNAGVYTRPVPSERAVHDLEHGTVWITYRPTLPATQVTRLTAFVHRQAMIGEAGGQANRYMDLSPWRDRSLPSPIVISSWGYQLRVSGPTDPRLQRFVDTFRHNNTYTPEYGAPVDGIPVQTGGNPASNGSRKPNPAGTADGQGM